MNGCGPQRGEALGWINWRVTRRAWTAVLLLNAINIISSSLANSPSPNEMQIKCWLKINLMSNVQQMEEWWLYCEGRLQAGCTFASVYNRPPKAFLDNTTARDTIQDLTLMADNWDGWGFTGRYLGLCADSWQIWCLQVPSERGQMPWV